MPIILHCTNCMFDCRASTSRIVTEEILAVRTHALMSHDICVYMSPVVLQSQRSRWLWVVVPEFPPATVWTDTLSFLQLASTSLPVTNRRPPQLNHFHTCLAVVPTSKSVNVYFCHSPASGCLFVSVISHLQRIFVIN